MSLLGRSIGPAASTARWAVTPAGALALAARASPARYAHTAPAAPRQGQSDKGRSSAHRQPSDAPRLPVPESRHIHSAKGKPSPRSASATSAERSAGDSGNKAVSSKPTTTVADTSGQKPEIAAESRTASQNQPYKKPRKRSPGRGSRSRRRRAQYPAAQEEAKKQAAGEKETQGAEAEAATGSADTRSAEHKEKREAQPLAVQEKTKTRTEARKETYSAAKRATRKIAAGPADGPRGETGENGALRR
jgi:hypothetical protein